MNILLTYITNKFIESNNFKALKSHRFFKGVNFNILNTIEPPFTKKSKETLANYPISVKITNIPKDSSPNKHYKNPQIKIKEGTVGKKSPYIYYNTRKIVLYSDPKLEYIDPTTNIIKEYIIFNYRAQYIFQKHVKQFLFLKKSLNLILHQEVLHLE